MAKRAKGFIAKRGLIHYSNRDISVIKVQLFANGGGER
jgi:hypothetical protein